MTTPTHKILIWTRVEPEGEDSHTHGLWFNAETPEAAVERAAKEWSSGKQLYSTKAPLNVALAAVITIWPDGRPDQAVTVHITPQGEDHT